MRLTKRQRNEIFGTLTSNGMDAADCELHQNLYANIRGQVDLNHQRSDSWFTLWPAGREHLYDWNPNAPEDLINPAAREGLYNAEVYVGGAEWHRLTEADWNQVLSQIAAWAQEVKYEADTPDLWAELRQVPGILTAAQAAEASNAPFTPDEQAEISRRLGEIKQLVRERFELTDDQLAAIDQRLDDAEEAAKHTARKTWLYTFYGAVMSTFMTDEIPPHVIQTIVTTVLHGIGHLFGFGGPPPIIST